MREQLIYLDNAATTWPKSREVLEKMVELYLKIGVSPGRGSYDKALVAEDFIHKTRVKLAHLFGAPDPDRVIFTANATEGLNIALFGLLQPGDHVVTTRLEHNSVLRPLYHLQQRDGISCTLIQFDGQGFIDPDDVARAISAKTKLVVVNHASNVLGTVQPVAKVGQICGSHGIPLLVDGSQSGGQVAVNMGEMGASALVFTGHKSLYGPTGIGGLIVHPDLDIKSTRFGGTGIESKSMIHTQSFPHRLESGTHNLMGIIGLSLAIDYILGKGIESIHEQEMVLTRRLCEGLKAIKEVKLYGRSDLHGESFSDPRHLAVVAANIKGVDPEDLGAILDGDFNIAVRVGLHCAPLLHETLGTGDRGAVRFSMGHFNTESEIDQAIEAMAFIAARRS